MRILTTILAMALLGATCADVEAGPCRCRTDRDSAGRLCGARSAEARPGGLAPDCSVPREAGRAEPPRRLEPARRTGTTVEVDNPLGLRTPTVR